MYYLLLGLQYVGIAAIIGLIIYIISRKHASDRQILLLIISSSLLINCVGLVMEMQSTTMQEALLAVKFTYFGKPYIALGMLFFILTYCEKKMPFWLGAILVSMHLLVTALVLFCEHNTLYYSSIDFTYDGMFPHLECGHGIMYILYHCLVTIYLIVMVIFCTEYMMKNKNDTAIKRTLKLIMIPVVMVAGLIPFFLGKTNGFDTTFISYLISLNLIASVLIKDRLLDTLNLAMELSVNDLADGLLVLNNENEVIYSNKKMHSIYKFDKKEKTPPFLYELDSCLLEKKELILGNQVYAVSSRLLTENDIYYGKMYILMDKTQQNNYTKKLVEQTSIMKGLKERAEEANQFKSALVWNMSHEILSPVNTIVDMTDIILKDDVTSMQATYLNNIKTSGTDLFTLVDNILVFSKVESGEFELVEEAYEPLSMFNDLHKIFLSRADNKPVDILFDIDTDLPHTLIGDKYRLRQIIINLMNHSIDSTDNGCVTLKVEGKEKSNTELSLHVSIIDTGHGIKSEDLSRLFDIYQQVDANQSMEKTGFGLAISKKLVELLGGSLHAESEYEAGSVYSFEITQGIQIWGRS